MKKMTKKYLLDNYSISGWRKLPNREEVKDVLAFARSLGFKQTAKRYDSSYTVVYLPTSVPSNTYNSGKIPGSHNWYCSKFVLIDELEIEAAEDTVEKSSSNFSQQRIVTSDVVFDSDCNDGATTTPTTITIRVKKGCIVEIDLRDETDVKIIILREE